MIKGFTAGIRIATVVESWISQGLADDIKSSALEVLRDDNKTNDWHHVLATYLTLIYDLAVMPSDEELAWMLHRYPPSGSDEWNMVWSILCEAKNQEYQGNWDPLGDPGIQVFLAAIRR